MVYALYAFGIILVICELGHRLTVAFDQIHDEIGKYDWFLFSHEIQKMLPTMLIVSQKPVEFEIFGSLSGIRETFKKVCRLTHYFKY